MLRAGIVLWCLAGSVVVASAADPPKAAPPSTLDDELFKGLDEATKPPMLKPKSGTQPARSSKPAESTAPAEPGEKPKSTKPSSNPLDAELLKALEGDDGTPSKPQTSKSAASDGGGEARPARSASDDPFLRLTEQIRDVESRLRRTETGDETQQLQQGIVDELEKLIAQIEQQQQQRQQSQSQQQQQQPSPPQQGPPQQQPGRQPGQESQESSQARDSQEGVRNSTARKADSGDLRSLLEKAWGTLPERDRQAVMQSSVDDFPAKYQFVIEEYFRTLLKREE